MTVINNNNLDIFINSKDVNPGLIINPDSVNLKNIITYHSYYNSKVYFKTLSGKETHCRVNNQNSSKKIKLLINDNIYVLYPVIDTSLFSFDSRIVLQGRYVYDYIYKYDPYNEIESEEIVKINDGPDIDLDDIYCFLKCGGFLQTGLSLAGFNLGDTIECGRCSEIISLQFKFRSRIDKNTYYSFSLFENNNYYSAYGELAVYYGKISASLNPLLDWVKKIFINFN